MLRCRSSRRRSQRHQQEQRRQPAAALQGSLQHARRTAPMMACAPCWYSVLDLPNCSWRSLQPLQRACENRVVMLKQPRAAKTASCCRNSFVLKTQSSGNRISFTSEYRVRVTAGRGGSTRRSGGCAQQGGCAQLKRARKKAAAAAAQAAAAAEADGPEAAPPNGTRHLQLAAEHADRNTSQNAAADAAQPDEAGAADDSRSAAGVAALRTARDSCALQMTQPHRPASRLACRPGCGAHYQR